MSTPTQLHRLRSLLTPVAAAALAFAAQAQTLGPALNLSNSAAYSQSGQIAVAASDVYAAWVEPQRPDKQIIRFARSADGGASFGSPVTVLSAGIGCCGPHVAADGSYVYVARTSNLGKNKPRKVYLRASTNHGMSFGPEIQVPNAGELHAIAAAGSSVQLLWSGAGGLFVSSSANGGASFAPAVAVSGGFAGAGGVMRALGPSVHVAWAQVVANRNEVFYSRSLDSGASFSTPLNLSNSATLNSGFPQLALAGANVYVVYRETEHRLARSTDGGASFSAPVDLTSGFADQHGLGGGPQLAASGAVLHVIWYSDPGTPGDYYIFHRSSLDGGDNFGATTNLSPIPPPSTHGLGVLAAEGSNAYVAWSLAGEVWIRQSVDSGASFAAAVNVSASAGTSAGAFIAAQPGGVHVG
jgi:hypothetical protein